MSGGYAGGWPWSFSGTDAYGRVPVEPLLRFAERHPDLVESAGSNLNKSQVTSHNAHKTRLSNQSACDL